MLGLDPIRQRNQVRRRVGLLSHASHLYDDLTVRENVRFAVRAAGADTGRIDDACARWGLTGRLLKTSASKLSAGQRRRVALAVLAARWPELWLLDEPHAGLDASARHILDGLVPEAAASGVTVVIASHEAEFVESLATRAVVVTGGRVTAERPGRCGAGARRRGRAAPAPGPTPAGGRWPMWRDTVLVAGKDLRIEARSRVALSQVAPFGIVALAMFAFALGPGPRPSMAKGAPGLFWVAVLFCTVLAVQRSVSVESVDGARDGLRLSGLDPAGLFLGKAAAVAAQLVVLELVLGVGVTLLYGARIETAVADRGLLCPRDHRAGGHRHPLRRALGRAPGQRDAAALPAPAHRRAGPAGRHPHLAGGPGRGRSRPTRARGSGCWWCSTPCTWPLASWSTDPSRSRHDTLDHPDLDSDPEVSTLPLQSSRARWTVRIIGIAAAVGVAVTVWLGLWVTPPDVTQGNTVPGDLVRLVYIHPGVAWVALYLAFGLAAVASLLYLWPRTRSMFWDRLAAAVGRGRRGVQRVHPDLGIDLGPADLGGLLGLGRPADPDRGLAGAVPRVHGAAPDPRRTGQASQAECLRRPCSPRSTSPSTTSRSCGGGPSIRGPPFSTPTSRRPSTGRWPGRS